MSDSPSEMFFHDIYMLDVIIYILYVKYVLHISSHCSFQNAPVFLCSERIIHKRIATQLFETHI